MNDLPVLDVPTCDGCGACCMHMRYPPFLGHDDPRKQALPRILRDELEALLSTDWDDEDKPCFWLDVETRLCRHHEYRPDVCREFEVGTPSCHGFRYTSQVQHDPDQP